MRDAFDEVSSTELFAWYTDLGAALLDREHHLRRYALIDTERCSQDRLYALRSRLWTVLELRATRPLHSNDPAE